MGVVPLFEPGSGPLVVVHWVAPLEDHAVDARRPAEHFASGVIDPSTTHVRLGFGLVLPVVEPATDRIRQRGGHVDEDVELPIAPTSF